jgi:hypothetical protein
MELGEAASLADKFMMSVLFKVHSLPLSDRSGWAGQWWRNQQSRLPLRPSLDEVGGISASSRPEGRSTSRETGSCFSI